jgi:hypothetical protein
MQEMIEFFEMVSMNEAALGGRGKLSVLKARLALHIFERAVTNLKADLDGNAVAHSSVRRPK